MCVLQAEGENVSKLEKADILELTVRHLHRLRRPRDAAEDAHRFQVFTVMSQAGGVCVELRRENFTEGDKSRDGVLRLFDEVFHQHGL
jgi:hypothetical protein